MGMQFITNSTSDLSVEFLRENNIILIPMIYEIDDKEYFDNPLGGEDTMTRKAFYDAMRAGAQPKTSQINQATFEEVFEKVLAAGDDIFYVGFSGGLSGTTNNAFMAAEELKEQYPERKIHIVDSLTASMGEGHLVVMGVQAYKEGKSGEEIEALLKDALTHMQMWFTVDDLTYLKRGGRISATTAAVGTMLSIKPVLSIDDEGKLVSVEKAKGRKKAVKTLISRLEERAGKDFTGEIYLIHSDTNEADIKMLRDGVIALCGRDVTSVHELTPVIGTHTGPGLLALIYYVPGSKR